MKRWWLIVEIIFLIIPFSYVDIYASSNKVSKTVNFVKKEILRSYKEKVKKDNIKYKKNREKIKNEVCIKFKKKIIDKIIKKEDLELIDSLLDDRLPKDYNERKENKKKYKDRNLTERVGWKLIDDELTIVDYEVILEWLERVFRVIGDYGYRNNNRINGKNIIIRPAIPIIRLPLVR
jgi:uncharacterized protein YaaW (UPF0174 family)